MLSAIGIFSVIGLLSCAPFARANAGGCITAEILAEPQLTQAKANFLDSLKTTNIPMSEHIRQTIYSKPYFGLPYFFLTTQMGEMVNVIAEDLKLRIDPPYGAWGHQLFYSLSNVNLTASGSYHKEDPDTYVSTDGNFLAFGWQSKRAVDIGYTVDYRTCKITGEDQLAYNQPPMESSTAMFSPSLSDNPVSNANARIAVIEEANAQAAWWLAPIIAEAFLTTKFVPNDYWNQILAHLNIVSSEIATAIAKPIDVPDVWSPDPGYLADWVATGIKMILEPTSPIPLNFSFSSPDVGEFYLGLRIELSGSFNYTTGPQSHDPPKHWDVVTSFLIGQAIQCQGDVHTPSTLSVRNVGAYSSLSWDAFPIPAGFPWDMPRALSHAVNDVLGDVFGSAFVQAALDALKAGPA